MKKFGINQCNLDNIDYSTKSSNSFIFDNPNNTINKVSSCIINYEIINIDFLKVTNTFIINLRYSLSILYLSNECDNLYSMDKDVFTIEYIPLTKFVNGIDAYTIFKNKKFNTHVFIEDISCISTDSFSFIISIVSICVIEIIKEPSIYYIINNTLTENVYCSFHDGTNLNQNTKLVDTDLTKLSFQSSNKTIAFIGKNNNINSLYLLSKGRLSTLQSIANIDNINDYIFINKNTLTISYYDMDINYLISLNIITKKMTKFNIPCNFKHIENLQYESLNKTIYFLSNINNSICLCELKNNHQCTVVFDTFNVLDYTLIINDQNIIIKIEKNNSQFLFIFNINTKVLSPIMLSITFTSIHKFIAYKTTKNHSTILLLLHRENDMILVEHDLNTFESKILYTHSKIISFIIDIYSYDIYLIIDNFNFNEVLKLSNSISKSIIKSQSKIKEIYL